MNLSKNLTLAEVTKSNTDKRRGINEAPDGWTIGSHRAIAEEDFQPISKAFG